jgi:hypothetical protein
MSQEKATLLPQSPGSTLPLAQRSRRTDRPQAPSAPRGAPPGSQTSKRTPPALAISAPVLPGTHAVHTDGDECRASSADRRKPHAAGSAKTDRSTMSRRAPGPSGGKPDGRARPSDRRVNTRTPSRLSVESFGAITVR